MSNPSRPPREGVTPLSEDESPDAFIVYRDPDRRKRMKKLLESVPGVQDMLRDLDMDMVPSFRIPPDMTVDPYYQPIGGGRKMALADKGAMQFRTRTAEAKAVVDAAYRLLPTGRVQSEFTRDFVKAKMADTFFVYGGAENALGRLNLAYPKRNNSWGYLDPIDESEARAALVNCGLSLERFGVGNVRPYPIIPMNEDDEGVKISTKSTNGYPVLGKWNTPGAKELVLGLAASLGLELDACSTREEVFAWVRKLEEEQPHLIASLGKAKADYYSVAKLEDFRLRFYNALPRQIVLLIQRATQPFESASRSILQVGHSGIGITLTHGGGAALVDALEGQLSETKWAYVHVGDDSWLIYRDLRGISMFSLDCSNFDLTQHSMVTEEVHRVLADELAQVHPPSAWLWHALMRSRLVVTALSVVRRWKHAGPSGMPLQSKVNDMLMDVLIQRVIAGTVMLDVHDKEELLKVVVANAENLGFTVRVEDHVFIPGVRNIKDALAQRAFLFIGYYFHTRQGEVCVCTDLARTFAQSRYPTLKWMASAKERIVMEAMRLGSNSLNYGIPPVALEPVFEAVRLRCLELVTRALAGVSDIVDERLRWAVSENTFGVPTAPSMRGLLNAMQRDPKLMWNARVPSTLFQSEDRPRWADEVDEEQKVLERVKEEDELAVELRVPPAGRVLKPLRIPPRPQFPLAHPVTEANDGRPPPTARWAPDKPPRPAGEGSSRNPNGRLRRVTIAELDDWDDDSVDASIGEPFSDGLAFDEQYGNEQEYWEWE